MNLRIKMLSSLKNKYQDIMGECYDNTKLGSSKLKTDEEYVEPTKYRISTMTLIIILVVILIWK